MSFLAVSAQRSQRFELDWDVSINELGEEVSVCNYCNQDGEELFFVYSFLGVDSVRSTDIEYDILIGNNTTKPFEILQEKIGEVTNVKIPIVYSVGSEVRKLKAISFDMYEQNESLIRSKKSATFATQSKLSSGQWYKLQVNETGVYRLDANYFSALGIDITSVNPNKIKIYGKGGAALPQINTDEREDDLVENHIYVSSTGSSFGSTDYVLFYGESPHRLVVDTLNRELNHERNIYSDYSYYFLTIEGDDGLRIGNQNNSGTPTATITTSDAYTIAEQDEKNALNSGRNWYWLNFDNQTTQYYNIYTPGKVSNSEMTYTSKVMAQAYASAVTFSTTIGGLVTFDQIVPKNTVNSSGYGVTGYENVVNETINFSTLGNAESFQVEINFTGDANSNRNDGLKTHGFFDYATISYKQNLGGIGMQNFRSFESMNQEFSQFEITGTGIQVWNVTDSKEPKEVILNSTGGNVSFIEQSTNLNEYIVFSLSDCKVPLNSSLIANQDLHGVDVPDVVIITPEVFEPYAQELAAYRTSQGLDVLVTTPNLIYNEFSSGKQDVSAIRDFLKMLYDKSPDKLKYLILYGGASYDYRDVIEGNTNYVPTYQSRQSLHNVQTYASDDYYGFLTDGDGEWAENNTGNHEMKISIGRLPVLTIEEAAGVVQKIRTYENVEQVNGSWKNKIALVTDDGDNNLHVRDGERLAAKINEYHPAMHLTKLHIDAFEQIPVSGPVEESPDFHRAFDQFIDEGGLIVNYTGHGSPVQWGYEYMMSMSKIDAMSNSTKLPIYVTATCDFGVFDNPARKSGAVHLVTKPDGGAIAAVTTTRAVYASSNYVINEEFYKQFLSRKSDSSFSTLGEAYMVTKNNSLIGVNNRSFSLLGDPCLGVSFPENKILIDEINGQQVTSDADTLKALSVNRLVGRVVDAQENDLNFNGVLKATVYDRPADKVTLGSVNTPYNYTERTNLLFDGFVTVENGEFILEFPLSKDISYNFDQGKITLYIYDSTSTNDAIGVYDNLLIGGTYDNPVEDNEGPIAELFLNDETFTEGGYTHSNPVLIANLSDDNGINISSTSIGHEITVTLDGDPNSTQVLNSYYSAVLDNYREGKVVYPMSNIAEGEHVLTFVAWDTHNNPVVEDLSFVVGENVTFYNYPNPFSNETRFNIEQSRAGEPLELTMSFYNELGQEVYSHRYNYTESTGVIDNILWDGTFNGEVCASGVYLVRINLFYPLSGVSVEQITKTVLAH